MSYCEFLTFSSLAVWFSQADSCIQGLMLSEGVTNYRHKDIFQSEPIEHCRQESHGQLVSISIHSFVLLNFSHINFGI